MQPASQTPLSRRTPVACRQEPGSTQDGRPLSPDPRLEISRQGILDRIVGHRIKRRAFKYAASHVVIEGIVPETEQARHIGCVSRGSAGAPRAAVNTHIEVAALMPPLNDIRSVCR